MKPPNKAPMTSNIKIIEDKEDYLVISKPYGVVVHPGAGQETDTVAHWLIDKYPEVRKLKWKTVNRIGIVHRLDKDTSGIMVLAKTPEALKWLQDQFRNREVEKYYTALAYGKLNEHGLIEALLGKDPKDRKKQKVQMLDFGLDEREKKTSSTEYWTKSYYKYKNYFLSLLKVRIYTGRKHQIRAHLDYIDHPIIGDLTYTNKPSKRISKDLGLNRQFLHSRVLIFKDLRGKTVSYRDNLPEDLSQILDKIDEVV